MSLSLEETLKTDFLVGWPECILSLILATDIFTGPEF